MRAVADRAGAAGTMSELQALARLGRAAPLAVGAAVAAALLVAAGIAVELEGSVSISPVDRLFEIALGLACATCAALGALIVAAMPRQRVGIALVTGGTLGALWAVATPLAEGLSRRHRGAVGGLGRELELLRADRARDLAAAAVPRRARALPAVAACRGDPARRRRGGDTARDLRSGGAGRRRRGRARGEPARHPGLVDVARRARRRRRRRPVRGGRRR